MVRTVGARVDVLRNGAKFGELLTVNAPRLRMKSDAVIKTSLSTTVLRDDRVDWLTDELQPVLIIDGVEHKLGVFLPATVKESSDDHQTELVNVEAYDRCWRVQTVVWTGGKMLRAGTNYISAVESLLAECGITLLMKTPLSAVLSNSRTWDIGTSYISIINELLDEINYDELWFNGDGYAVLRPQQIPTAEAITQILNDSDVHSMMLPELSREQDIYSAPNAFLVVCSGPDRKTTLTAEAVNDIPTSPLSTVRRGRKIYKFLRLSDVPSQAELNRYAQLLRWESMGLGETVTVKTALRPGHGVGDVIGLATELTQGIFTETEWSCALAAGETMTHKLRRVIYGE